MSNSFPLRDDIDRPTIMAKCFFVASLLLQRDRQVYLRYSNVGMVAAQDFLLELERSFMDTNCSSPVALHLKDAPDIIQQPRSEQIVSTEPGEDPLGDLVPSMCFGVSRLRVP